MTTENKVRMWKIAYDGLPSQNAVSRTEFIQAISELEDEIAKRFDEHLPVDRKQRGNAVIREAINHTERTFKNPSNPPGGSLEIWVKLMESVSHVPKGE
jgi:hypothetical protein